jgi:hypothetical protein
MRCNGKGRSGANVRFSNVGRRAPNGSTITAKASRRDPLCLRAGESSEPSNVADARELADGVFAGMFSVDARAVLVLGDAAMNAR